MQPQLTVLLLAATAALAQPLPTLDRAIEAVMAKHRIPGAAVALSENGRVFYTHGYGVADQTTGETVRPEMLFRVGSISKPVTAMAILKLYEDGKLPLDARVFDLLKDYQPLPGRPPLEPALAAITVRQLLTHTAGFDPEVTGFDPLFPPFEEVVALGIPVEGLRDAVISYMLSEPLPHKPGTAQRYSNFGFLLLGRVIETVAGMPYEQYVQQALLAPMGITRMRLGGPLLADRHPDEVRYHDHPGAPLTASFYEPFSEMVPRPYGLTRWELVHSAGGWIASAGDLVRFVSHLDGTLGSSFQPFTMRQMLARPAGVPQDATFWHGFAWLVEPAEGGDYLWFHNGGLAGTYAFLLRVPLSPHRVVTIAAVFNGSPNDEDEEANIDRDMFEAIGGFLLTL